MGCQKAYVLQFFSLISDSLGGVNIKKKQERRYSDPKARNG